MSNYEYIDAMTGRSPYIDHGRTEQPDLMLISTDMVPPEFWQDGAYVPVRRTPAFDSLFGESTFFTNAFCTAPVCSPSRAAYLTGRHSYIMTNSERGHDGHAMHLRNTDTIFPEYLAAAGYHTRHIGKSHVGRNKFMDAFGENASPWDRWSPPWFDDDEYLSYLRDKGLGPISFERKIHGVAPNGKGTGNFYGGYIAAQNGKPFPIEGTYPWFLVERAIRTLESRQDTDKPVYLQLDFFAPHQPFAIPGDMTDREREIRDALGEAVGYAELEKNGFKAPWTEPRVYELYRKNWGLRERDSVHEYRVANLLQWEVIDRALGRFFEYLSRSGLYEQSTIAFLADHGEMNGNLALLDKGAFLNPYVLRVPLTVKPAKVDRDTFPQSRCETPVSLVDIAPTLLGLAGVEPLSRIDGHALQDTVGGIARPADRPIMAEVWSHVIPNPCVATLYRGADGQDYVFSFNICDPVSELYRIDDTPLGEKPLENLFLDPDAGDRCAEAIQVMEQRLAADERWKGYHAYFQLVFADHLASTGDRQRFM